MSETSNIGKAGTYGDEGGLDPRQAARLLAHTQRQARRGFDFRSPRLSLLAAAVALVAFGAVWLSVRGQHPYKGPTPAGLVVLYAVVLIRILSVVFAHRRAQAGVSGRSVHRLQAEGATLVVALLAVYVVMAALAVNGAGDGIVYGVYVATATMLVLGVFWQPARRYGRTGRNLAWRSRSSSSPRAARSQDPAACGSATAWACALCSWPTAPYRLGCGARLDPTHDDSHA